VPASSSSASRRPEPVLGRILSSRWTKAGVFVACLAPFLLLLWPFYKLVTTGDAPQFGANPVEYITHYTGDWTIRFLLITLAVTPLRKIFNQPKLARYRRMLGLFAFFYVSLHFMTWFILDKSFSFSDMWADVLKRRFITV
jgi:methionine sulfoxide reductase heme-binding subunit